VDGDGDIDVLSASTKRFAWYENIDGMGTFGPELVIAGQDYPFFFSVAVADLDGDGDVDALSADGTTSAWYENVDGQGSFGSVQVIGRQADGGADFIEVADVDGDGDVDVLTAAFERIAWYEQRILGDVNDDRLFNSSDLVRVFQVGEYEDEIVLNSTFDEGDWNGDSEFDSTDFVAAFQAGHYETGAAVPVADIAAAIDRFFAEQDWKQRRFLPAESLSLTLKQLGNWQAVEKNDELPMSYDKSYCGLRTFV
jgi:hypothetical protein